MNEQVHILISGRDEALLATRASVLRTAGYRVSATLGPVSSRAELSTVGLLVICHTLSEEERTDDLTSLATTHPGAKALCLVPHMGVTAQSAATLDSYSGPREMLRVIHRLLTT